MRGREDPSESLTLFGTAPAFRLNLRRDHGPRVPERRMADEPAGIAALDAA